MDKAFETEVFGMTFKLINFYMAGIQPIKNVPYDICHGWRSNITQNPTKTSLKATQYVFFYQFTEKKA